MKSNIIESAPNTVNSESGVLVVTLARGESEPERVTVVSAGTFTVVDQSA
jgi:hypothetical protein